MSWRRWICLGFAGFALAAVQRPAAAQLAPMGAHYAGRPSDTGFSGVGASGGYAASIPLELPEARGGLPVPLGITYSERGVGAAGLGWDVPLSYVRRETTLVHRRPFDFVDQAPVNREQVALVLDGSRTDLVRRGTAWSARQNAPQLQATESGSGWQVSDGSGRTYVFTAPASALIGANLWLLTQITNSTGDSVSLSYTIGTPAVAGTTGLSIDLASVSYNAHPTIAGCFKTSINLVYDADSTAPLSIKMMGDRVLTRMHKLTAVDVLSRPTCGANGVSLRRYQLNYQVDPDTRQPRLASAQLFGQAGTPEQSTPITLGQYSYGSATNAGQLTYQAQPPEHIGAANSFGRTFVDNVLAPPDGIGVIYHTSATVLDLTGDGLPEEMSNISLPLRPTTLEMRAARQKRYTYSNVVNDDRLWRQAIDVNGDGRIDIIDAAELPGSWVIYLNTPTPGAPATVAWQRRVTSIAALTQRLRARGYVIETEYLPLSRRSTAHMRVRNICMKLVQGEWLVDPNGFASGHCTIREIESDSEDTYVEWEVRDMNGDGYPDVVFNSTPARASSSQIDSNLPPPDPRQGTQYGTVTVQDRIGLLGGPNEIDAVFNVLGVHMDSGASYAFSAPVALRSNAGCGIGFWQGSTTGIQQLVCGLAEVNGDGITDYVSSRSVFLGTGSLAASSYFTPSAAMTLPGQLAIQNNQQVSRCAPPATANTTFHVTQTAGLRDVTGDGIPDYLLFTGPNWNVWVGTGAGLAAAIPGVVGVGALSDVVDDCGGVNSVTAGGLYDLRATGVPAFVTGTPAAATLSELVGSSGVPGAIDAGRLVQVDNGFGARTTITYRSEKTDHSTLHQLASPEIVVSSVQTAGSQGLGGTLASTQYAYGGAVLVFDSFHDGFKFPGYLQSVELQIPTGANEGLAVLTYRNGLPPPSGATVSADERHARNLGVGSVNTRTVLSGAVGTSARALLAAQMSNDPRMIRSTHVNWAALALPVPAGTVLPYPCPEMIFPYDYDASLAYAQSHPAAGYDACWEPAFLYELDEQAWRGAPGAAPPAAFNIETLWRVTGVDAQGRVTGVTLFNDLNRSDDDECVTTTYASPGSSSAQIFSAVAKQAVTNCAGRTLAGESWIYDGLPEGNISTGLLTSHSVERRDDQGALLATFKQLEVPSRDVFGNPLVMFTQREDRAVHKATMVYDEFALAPMSVRIDATGTATTITSIARDPVTLDPTLVTDPNGMKFGSTYDGFARSVLSTITPPSGPSGAVSVTSYAGFSPADAQGRRVTHKVFTDPVAPASVATAVGRTSTAFLDELGRQRETQVQLGADYGNETLVIGQRSYDLLGRVAFEADPYPRSQSASTAYGTTSYFHTDGTRWCDIRGAGVQSFTTVTDAERDIYPTCFDHMFQDKTEIAIVYDAAGLSGGPQANVVRITQATAVGHLLARSTWQGSTRLEHATFTSDALGRQTSMTRYRDAMGGTQPVTTSWRFDSLGRLVELHEPDAAPQLRTYSNWGEQLQTQWTDTTTATPTDHRVVSTYDGLGRLTHQEERSGSVVDPATVHDYAYDLPVSVSPHVAPGNVRGRLARASWPTGSVAFSYDPLGHVAAQSFSDNQGGLYVETHAFHADGSLSAIDLMLPDTAFADERIDYTYDSAGRARGVSYTSASHTDSLFTATTLDPWGRIRQARFGNTAFSANFQDTGRRLLQDVTVSSVVSPTVSRKISVAKLDPVGREMSRVEIKNGAATGTTTTYTYDALGRLATAQQNQAATVVLNRAFGYDPLGNVTGQQPPTGPLDTPSVQMTYLDTDRDRICRIGYGTAGLGGTACNVKYDGVGNITEQKVPNSVRQLSYFASGQVRSITQGATSAQFRYDAFGAVQELTVESSASFEETIDGIVASDTRHDRHYGPMLTWRDEAPSGAITSVLTRKIPGPGGFFATRHGAGGKWSFEFGEQRGTRFVTDPNGTVVQDIDYAPFGEAKSTGSQAAPGKPFYTTSQWNGGDALAALGVSQLGARLYDPVIGRFLSRDPLLIPRTAATTNPYAFANNDPINASDPSGLSPSCEGKECKKKDTEPVQWGGYSWLGVPLALTFPHGGVQPRGGGGGYFSHPTPAPTPAAADPAAVQNQININNARAQAIGTLALSNAGTSEGGSLRGALADAIDGVATVAGGALGGFFAGLGGALTGPGEAIIIPAGAIAGAGLFRGAVSGWTDLIRGEEPTVVRALAATADGMSAEMGGLVLGKIAGPYISRVLAARGSAAGTIQHLTRTELKQVTAGAAKEIPSLDITGKVHGILPTGKELSSYTVDELEVLANELRRSIPRRIEATKVLGSDAPHGERQAGEQFLLRQINKLLGDQ